MITAHNTHWSEYHIENAGTSHGQCECCGYNTQRKWGFITRNDIPVGSYFVTWTTEKPDHGAQFDLILGAWGDGTSPDDRYSVSADLRVSNGAPQFMVIDAENRISNNKSLFVTALRRVDVIGTPIASSTFTIIDAIFMSDEANELRDWCTADRG